MLHAFRPRRVVALGALALAAVGAVTAPSSADVDTRIPTTLKAQPSIAYLVPGTGNSDTRVFYLQARLSGPSGWIGGQNITFNSNTGVQLCIARTNSSGYAACNARPIANGPGALGGYRAWFYGDATYQPSTDHAALIEAPPYINLEQT